MKRPFDYIDGKKIDLSNLKHRDIVINRNKKLEKSLREGLAENHAKIEITITASLDCIVCGTSIETSEYDTYDYTDYHIHENIPTIKCSCCKTKYIYDSREYIFSVYLDKPKIKSLK